MAGSRQTDRQTGRQVDRQTGRQETRKGGREKRRNKRRKTVEKGNTVTEEYTERNDEEK